jgi:hypothetical protein
MVKMRDCLGIQLDLTEDQLEKIKIDQENLGEPF